MAEFSARDRITMMAIISAAGESGPPLFVFKGSRMPYRTVLKNGVAVDDTPACNLPPRSCVALRLENGGVDSENFRNWALRFVTFVSDLTEGGRKVLLTYDAYRAHLSLEVLELFSANNIIVYAVPAHTSGKSQPLDVVLFSSFKNALNDVALRCTSPDITQKLGIFEFFSFFREAYAKSFTTTNIQAGFRRSGLCPLDIRRLLGVPRPASSEVDAPLLSVEALEKLFEQKQEEFRRKVLGSDATMTQSGFVDTTCGQVMTAPQVLALVREKCERGAKKAKSGARTASALCCGGASKKGVAN